MEKLQVGRILLSQLKVATIFVSLFSSIQSYNVLSLEISAINIAAIASAASFSILVTNSILMGVDLA